MALTKRDTFLLCACAVVIFISFGGDHSFRSAMMDSASYSVHHHFSIPLDTSYFLNRHFPGPAEQIPNPIVTDLDGDGVSEMVVATADRKLRVYDLSHEGVEWHHMSDAHHFQSKDLPVRYSASLIPDFGVDHDRMPIALATGYVDPMGNAYRKQVVVVVTEGMNVLCFDEKLQLIWETTIDAELMSRDFYHKEAAIVIAPIPTRVDDEGVVIVSLRPASSDNAAYADRLVHEHVDAISSEDPDEAIERMRMRKLRDPELNLLPDDDDDSGKEELQHYSLYAFCSVTGALRWKHESGDFEDPTDVDDSHFSRLLPEHTLKLHVFKNDLHSGELPWEYYRDSMLAQLPHSWHSRSSSALTVAHFERQRRHGQHGGAKGSPWSRSSSLLLSNVHSSLLHAAGVPISSQGPAHSELEHVEQPNVVVAHTSEGVEVLHLHTGRPLCALELPNKNGVYADVNGDGVVDHLQAVVSKRDGEKSCLAWVVSGLPGFETLSSSPICEAHGFQLFSLKKNKKKKLRIDAGPIALLDRKPYLQGSKGYDHLYLVSTGDITSLDPSGRENWKVVSAATWEPRTPQRDLLANAFVESAFKASLSAHAMEVFGEERHVIAVGRSSISIVSQDGYEVATADVCDGVPMGQEITVGDMNDDGVNDFVVVTSDTICGYRVERHTSSFVVPFIALTFLVVIALLSVGANSGDVSAVVRKRRRFDHARNTHVE